jgi:hypothetical protein
MVAKAASAKSLQPQAWGLVAIPCDEQPIPKLSHPVLSLYLWAIVSVAERNNQQCEAASVAHLIAFREPGQKLISFTQTQGFTVEKQGVTIDNHYSRETSHTVGVLKGLALRILFALFHARVVSIQAVRWEGLAIGVVSEVDDVVPGARRWWAALIPAPLFIRMLAVRALRSHARLVLLDVRRLGRAAFVVTAATTGRGWRGRTPSAEPAARAATRTTAALACVLAAGAAGGALLLSLVSLESVATAVAAPQEAAIARKIVDRASKQELLGGAGAQWICRVEKAAAH